MGSAGAAPLLFAQPASAAARGPLGTSDAALLRRIGLLRRRAYELFRALEDRGGYITRSTQHTGGQGRPRPVDTAGV